MYMHPKTPCWAAQTISLWQDHSPKPPSIQLDQRWQIQRPIRQLNRRPISTPVSMNKCGRFFRQKIIPFCHQILSMIEAISKGNDLGEEDIWRGMQF